MEGQNNEIIRTGEKTIVYQSETAKQMEAIRAKYMPKEPENAQESVLHKMKRLDYRAECKALNASLQTGIPSSLVLGLGMSFALVWNLLFIGIIFGLFGLAGIAATPFIYQRVLRREREKIAPEIIALTKEV